ncbi:DUF3828 domain-containing protein [Rhodoplanes roseus]|nr:DUF3828 domain-containing protein [Rhodoplanes roseus]
MFKRILTSTTTAATLTLALLAAAPARAQFATPEEAVTKLYAFYGTGKTDLMGLPQDKKTLRRFFVPAIVQGYEKAELIDADFFIQGQDFELSDVKVAPAAVTGDKATVAVELKNMGQPLHLDFELAKGKDGWRIADARTPKGDTLRKTLARSR